MCYGTSKFDKNRVVSKRKKKLIFDGTLKHDDDDDDVAKYKAVMIESILVVFSFILQIKLTTTETRWPPSMSKPIRYTVRVSHLNEAISLNFLYRNFKKLGHGLCNYSHYTVLCIKCHSAN